MNEESVIWPGRHHLSAVRSVAESQEDTHILPQDPCPQTLHPQGQGVSPVCRDECGALQAGKGVGGSDGGQEGTRRGPEAQKGCI